MDWHSDPVVARSEFAAIFENPPTNVYERNLLFFVYSILEILRGEARVLEGLHNLGVKGEHHGTLLKLPVNHAADSYALDIRHPSIMVSPVQRHYSLGQISTASVLSLCAHTRA